MAVTRPWRGGGEEALAWLAERAHEKLGTEIAFRNAGRFGWHVDAVAGPDGRLGGLSVSSPGGQWHLEATSLAATAELVDVVALRSRRGWPARVTTPGTVKGWLQPALAERKVVPFREHDQLAMVCRTPLAGGEGRWATPADRPALERYQALYNEERRTTIAPDWDTALQHRTIAVLESDGRIVAAVKRTADTARYATIGGTWTDPAFRGRGLARRLATFLVGAVIQERPAVHLIVDDDNSAAIALYRSLRFQGTGSCYMAYLR